ncbi:hypothetical protein TNCV_3588001 [Trichonephila clavipes]|nr:hypothetical protein TNCV_3588001 [Trichonephila clavipes]
MVSCTLAAVRNPFLMTSKGVVWRLNGSKFQGPYKELEQWRANLSRVRAASNFFKLFRSTQWRRCVEIRKSVRSLVDPRLEMWEEGKD